MKIVFKEKLISHWLKDSNDRHGDFYSTYLHTHAYINNNKWVTILMTGKYHIM
jgi:hypothetical protein